MRWPRLSVRHSENSNSSRRQSRPSSSSSSETPPADKEANPPSADSSADYHDPSLTRLFSDATSYNQILNTYTDVAGDSRVAHDCPNGFSQLVACDLDDHELVASETFAQLTVSNWAPGEPTDLAPDVGIDESEEGPSEGERDTAEPSGITYAAAEPKLEDKLNPDEVLDLLQQDFGALAPPGEEKLLLETDATLFQEVVVLVCQLILDNPRFMLTSRAGGGAPYHTSPHISCIAPVVSTWRERKDIEVRSGYCTLQGAAPQEESLAPVNTRYDQHVPFQPR